MAEFSDDLENYFRTTTEITLSIGYGAEARVFPDVPSQGAALPFIVLEETGGDSEEHLTGGAGLVRSVWAVSVYGETRSKANKLAERIKELLRPFNGVMGGSFVTEISCSNHRQAGTDLNAVSANHHRYWTLRIFDIWHNETT